jgi:NAD(P)-dependent dehydrogenase (short-subunit alcohol dehydrogenase family)
MSPGQRRVVVVGAASGIGAATAALFHANGDRVLSVDRCTPRSPTGDFAKLDLRDPDAIESLLAQIGPGWDVLAHIAGVPGTHSADDVLTVNFLGARLMVEGMLPLMNPGGAIVAVASTAGMAWRQRTADLAGLLQCATPGDVAAWQQGQDPNYPVYSTSKEALIIFAKKLAATAWSECRVRVNTVSPGPVETPILREFEATMGKEILDFAEATVGRHARVDDIAPAIAFLASDDAKWIVGQDVQVDAGFANSMMISAMTAV